MTESDRLAQECYQLIRQIRRKAYSTKLLRLARDALRLYAAYKAKDV